MQKDMPKGGLEPLNSLPLISRLFQQNVHKSEHRRESTEATERTYAPEFGNLSTLSKTGIPGGHEQRGRMED